MIFLSVSTFVLLWLDEGKAMTSDHAEMTTEVVAMKPELADLLYTESLSEYLRTSVTG